MSDSWNTKGLRGATLSGLALIAITFGGFGTWAATVPLAGAVVTSGTVKVVSNRKQVQHDEGGEVVQVH